MESQIFEIGMLVCFGMAWPFSIYKSIKSKTTAGKSQAFLWVVFVGYLMGITNKLINDEYKIVLVFYVVDLLLVGTDLLLYFRNRARDRQK